MTEEDYKLIADAISNARVNSADKHIDDGEYHGAHSTLDYLTQVLADKLANDNPRFNRDKFIDACDRQG